MFLIKYENRSDIFIGYFYFDPKFIIISIQIIARLRFNISFWLKKLIIFTFSSHTEYVKRESILIAWVKKKFSSFNKCSWFVCLRRRNKPKKIFICLSVCLDVWMYVRTWTFHVDTITFEGVSGSKQNLVGVFYLWNVGLVLKSKVISWSWS